MDEVPAFPPLRPLSGDDKMQEKDTNLRGPDFVIESWDIRPHTDVQRQDSRFALYNPKYRLNFHISITKRVVFTIRAALIIYYKLRNKPWRLVMGSPSGF